MLEGWKSGRMEEWNVGRMLACHVKCDEGAYFTVVVWKYERLAKPNLTSGIVIVACGSE